MPLAASLQSADKAAAGDRHRPASGLERVCYTLRRPLVGHELHKTVNSDTGCEAPATGDNIRFYTSLLHVLKDLHEHADAPSRRQAYRQSEVLRAGSVCLRSKRGHGFIHFV